MKKVAVVKLTGGLGNTMFQYAFGLALKKEYQCKIFFDLSEKSRNDVRRLEIENFNMVFLESVPFFLRFLFFHKSLFRDYLVFFKQLFMPTGRVTKNKVLTGKTNIIKTRRRLMFTYIYNSTSLAYDLEEENKPNFLSFYQGFFQSPNYFREIRDELLSIFRVNENVLHKNYSKELKKLGSTIAIHVRRGDYVNKENLTKHGVLPIDYFFSGIKFVTEKNPNIKNLILFSDDINWVKKNFSEVFLNMNITYVDNLISYSPVYELILFSKFKNLIISNSTFSWWGAWLNQNDDKLVIYPNKWFQDEDLNSQIKDLFDKNWIGL